MSEFKKTYIGRALDNLKRSPKFKPYSRVNVIVSDKVQYTAGDDTGETLTVKSPWGTQQVANNLLNKYRGFQYQPYEADGGSLDPSAEIGDGVSTGRVYGGLYSEDLSFDLIPHSDFGAPYEEQINHEIPYKSKKDREIRRQFDSVESTLTVHAGLISAEVTDRTNADNELSGRITVNANDISARVTKTGGDYNSFGWELESDHWSVDSNGSEVFRIDSTGAQVKGKITAESGLIGGFDIDTDSLSTNGGTFEDCSYSGIYIGPSGININNNFKVDSSGNLQAENGSFNGMIQAGNILHGDDYGYLDGSGISQWSIEGGEYGQLSSQTIIDDNIVGSTITGGSVAGSTITSGNLDEYVNSSLDAAETAASVVSYTDGGYLVYTHLLQVTGGWMELDGTTAQWVTKTFVDGRGNTVTLNFIGHY